MGTEYECAHIISTSDLTRIEAGWRDLQQRHPPLTPFASYEWMSAWYRHIAFNSKHVVPAPNDSIEAIDVVVARYASRIVALMPMVRTTRGALRSAATMGYWEMVFDPGHPGAVESLLRTVLSDARPGSCVDLMFVPRDSPTRRQLQAACQTVGIPLYATRAPRMALIECGDGMEAYVAARRGLFKSLRKQERRLRRLGTVAYTVERGNDLDAALERLISLEGMAWKASAGSAIRSQPHHVAFYTDVAKRFAGAGRFAIHFLTLDGEAIAGRYSLEWGDTLYELKTGYDPAHSKYSPGNVLGWHCAQSLFSTPHLRVSDQLDIEAGEWKRRWMTSLRHCDNLHLFPPTFGGALRGFVRYGVRSQLKRSRRLVALVDKVRSRRRAGT